MRKTREEPAGPSKPKVEWTPSSLAQTAGSALLVVASLLLLWFAFANWRFKSALSDAYRAYDTKPVSSGAADALTTALSWRSDHAGALLLLAKIRCDEGKFDESRRRYEELIRLGHDGGLVQTGLGVISLKEAEKATEPKDVNAALKKAIDAFVKAGNLPEAEAGLGHCDLLLAHKTGDAARLAAARRRFEALQKRMGGDARLTRDGLIDYYAGLGKALASGDKPDVAGAADAFRGWVQYTKTSPVAQANVLAMETRRWSEFAGTPEDLVKAKDAISAMRVDGNAWRNQKELKEPFLQWALAVSRAWGRAGKPEEAEALIRDLTTSADYQGRIEPFFVDALLRLEAAMRPDLPAGKVGATAGAATAAFNNVVKQLPVSDAGKETKARALNAIAWLAAASAGEKNAPQSKLGADKANEAFGLAPSEYVYIRNALVLMKRGRVPAAQITALLEKAQGLGTGPWADDFAKVKQYIDSK